MYKVREMQPAGNVAKTWTNACISSDGQTLMAVVFGGRMYRSTNRGYTWAEIRPAGDTNINWDCLATNRDMSVIVAGINPGRLYLSINTGASFSEIQPTGATNQTWRGGAVSNNGQVIMVNPTTQVKAAPYLSLNGGSTWTSKYPIHTTALAPATYIKGICMNDNGSIIVAANFDLTSGQCMISYDTGTTWSDKTPNGVKRYWISSACNSVGDFIILGGYGTGGSVWTSTDYGVSWNERKPGNLSDRGWYVSCDSTGRYCLAADLTPGRLWISNDYGVTWTETRPFGAVDRGWSYSVENRNTGAYFYQPINNATTGRTVKLSKNQMSKINEAKIY